MMTVVETQVIITNHTAIAATIEMPIGNTGLMAILRYGTRKVLEG